MNLSALKSAVGRQ